MNIENMLIAGIILGAVLLVLCPNGGGE